MIKKIKGEFCTLHCHGPKAGEVISCFETREKAEKQHRAIMAGKYKKIEIDINKLI